MLEYFSAYLTVLWFYGKIFEEKNIFENQLIDEWNPTFAEIKISIEAAMHDAWAWWPGGRGEGGAGAAQHAADRGVSQHRHSRHQQRAHASQH